jgi:protein-tyrosine phosphatase
VITPERHLVLDGLFNVRDLGGYATQSGQTVKWSRLYRADGIHRLAGDDLEKVRTLGLRTVIDLRTPGELVERGRFPTDAIPVEYHHLPMLEKIWDKDTFDATMPAVRFLADRYAEMFVVGADSITRALTVLADEAAYPAVFHCAAGKDRTGVLAAVVLSLLGVADDDIAQDYALSRLGMDRMLDWLKTSNPDAFDAMTNQPQGFLDAPRDAMDTLLAAVARKHGSMEGYVEGLGVANDTVAALRRLLLA